jgi:hypothetical protein
MYKICKLQYTCFFNGFINFSFTFTLSNTTSLKGKREAVLLRVLVLLKIQITTSKLVLFISFFFSENVLEKLSLKIVNDLVF